jgi:hypothetical protein
VWPSCLVSRSPPSRQSVSLFLTAAPRAPRLSQLGHLQLLIYRNGTDSITPSPQSPIQIHNHKSTIQVSNTNPQIHNKQPTHNIV